MKTKLLAMMFLAGGSMFAQTRFSIGIGIGEHGAGYYQGPPSYAANIPPCPGPDYFWVDGYWSQNYGRDTWVDGYWDRRPLRSGYVVEPRFDYRFRDRDDRNGHDRDFDRGRNFREQEHNQVRGYNQAPVQELRQPQTQNHNIGAAYQNQNTNHNRSNNQDNHQGSNYANGFRAR